VIPLSGGMTERQVQLIADFKPEIIMVTPSYMLAIADEMEKQGLDPKRSSLRVGIFGAEPWTNEMRKQIESRTSLEAIDIYGLSEVIGPGVAQECVETKDGLTIWEDHFYPEIVDPATGEPVPEGEPGELVFTSLTKEAMPVIRYRTRDLTRLLPPTARSMRRMEKITGPDGRHAHHPRRERVPYADRGADPQAARARPALRAGGDQGRPHGPPHGARRARARRAGCRLRREAAAPHQVLHRRERRREPRSHQHDRALDRKSEARDRQEAEVILGLTRKSLEDAASLVHETVAPTPQFSWPLLNERAGTEVWVKHENHTATGSFKVRGGLVLAEHLKRENPRLAGVVSATRGNHGQSVAFAGRRHGLRRVIVVPHGNSKEKNAAMRAWGAELIEHGRDYDEAREHANALSRSEGLHYIGPFDRWLVAGVGSYALELFSAVQDLDEVYVPIGCGSGICGVVAWRDALGLKTRVVGVVSENAPCYALSFAAGKPVETKSANTFADGVAVRVPVPEALEAIRAGVERIVPVSDDEVKAAMRDLYRCTHNVAEGAGAAPLAALLKDKGRQGSRFAVILSGGNIDREMYLEALSGTA
jgi:threonine dehydratase